ncbi:hypothetical protein [Microcoleus sp. S13_C5]|uniref:hypothetical protein n=1 Tax=Microcoleus sp. S13_C5 TaxID=3055411 RepID=UPI002FD4C6B0
MKRKLNLLCYSFGPEAPTRLQNCKKCKLSADTARPATTCTAGTVPVTGDPFTCAHLTSGPNPQMFSGKTTDTPALHLCVEEVTASISRSDIIGTAIKK